MSAAAPINTASGLGSPPRAAGAAEWITSILCAFEPVNVLGYDLYVVSVLFYRKYSPSACKLRCFNGHRAGAGADVPNKATVIKAKFGQAYRPHFQLGN